MYKSIWSDVNFAVSQPIKSAAFPAHSSVSDTVGFSQMGSAGPKRPQVAFGRIWAKGTMVFMLHGVSGDWTLRS